MHINKMEEQRDLTKHYWKKQKLCEQTHHYQNLGGSLLWKLLHKSIITLHYNVQNGKHHMKIYTINNQMLNILEHLGVLHGSLFLKKLGKTNFHQKLNQ